MYLRYTAAGLLLLVPLLATGCAKHRYCCRPAPAVSAFPPCPPPPCCPAPVAPVVPVAPAAPVPVPAAGVQTFSNAPPLVNGHVHR